jgi:hypothetical protein
VLSSSFWPQRLIPARTRQYRDDALFARRHISVLSVGDRVARSDLQDMSARCDLYFLGLVGDFFRLTGLHAVDEHDGSHGRTHYDQFGRIGNVGFAMKPATARNAKQQDNKEYFQWTTLTQRKQRAYHARSSMVRETHRCLSPYSNAIARREIKRIPRLHVVGRIPWIKVSHRSNADRVGRMRIRCHDLTQDLVAPHGSPVLREA